MSNKARPDHFPDLKPIVASSIYSNDEEQAFALVRFQCDPKGIAEAVRAGKFPLDRVKPAFEKMSQAIQEAIKEGKGNVST